jgi:hypothetical protein
VAIGGEGNAKASGNRVLHNLIGTDKKGSNKNPALLNKEEFAVVLFANSVDNRISGNTLAIAKTTAKKDAIVDRGKGNVENGNTILGGKSARRGSVTVEGGGAAVSLSAAAGAQTGSAASHAWSLQPPPASPTSFASSGQMPEGIALEDAVPGTVTDWGRARKRDAFFAQAGWDDVLVGLTSESG